ncbi:MAG: VWA domain-containing protein [Acidobacteria bacterium]|nr:VWA domain-containing protein [Acidobacteriota bacterium]
MIDNQECLACTGLVTTSAPVPLVGVSVEAWVRDIGARVTVTQKYRNQEDKPIEAVYIFPLDEGAAVCGFEALIDNVRVLGRVKEREEAFEEYDDALEAGHGAYLLDQEKPDVFTASIGNVPPGKEVTVRVSYVTELGCEGDSLQFVIPTTVAPRYAPRVDRKGVGRPPAEALNPPIAWNVPYGLSLLIHLDMSSAVRAIESPTHPISVDLDGMTGTVRLGGRESALDRDFVMLLQTVDSREPRVSVEVDEKGNRAAALTFRPKLDLDRVPSEIIFVIDRSGSMQGTSIAEARNALQLCLRSLSQGTRFNIVGFGSRFEMMFPATREYCDEALRQASSNVDGVDADLGGTEILAPLEAIFQNAPIRGFPRQLFVLTDGQVTNTEAVMKLIRRNSHTTRVFSFGIGAGPSRHLIRGMARAGNGCAELISPGERIEPKVVRQLAKALAPALSDVKLDWGTLDARQAPCLVPPVFAGGRVTVYGFLEGERKGVVTLGAIGPGGPVSYKVEVDPQAARPGNLVATLAARAMIRDLEEGTSPLHNRQGSAQGREKKDRVKGELVRLGVTFGLCSRETSFVAVEERGAPTEGEMQLRRVPIALTRDWGGLHGDLSSRPMAIGSVGSRVPRGVICGAPPASTAPLHGAPIWQHEVFDGDPLDVHSFMRRKTDEESSRESRIGSAGSTVVSASTEERAASGLFGAIRNLFRRTPASADGGQGAPSPASVPPPRDQGGQAPGSTSQESHPKPKATDVRKTMHWLLSAMCADGSWLLTERLAEIVGRRLGELEAALAGANGSRDDVRSAWATALALAWLEEEAPQLRDEWRLVGDKARKWLANCPATLASGEDWIEAARECLRNEISKLG